MDREQKAAAVAELTEDLKGAEAIFAVDYRGISVTEAAELRGKLREADAIFKVVKNRLAKRAAADAGTELDELLVGPTALTLIKGDAVLAAKAIADFAKVHTELEYKGGIMDGAALDPDAFMVIARLPGLDVLHAQIVMMVASPLTGLARGLGAMISGLAIALGQIAEQGLVSGEPPAAEEAPPADAPAADAPADAPAEEPADDASPTQPDAPEDETPAEEEAPAPAEEPAAEEAPAAEAEAPPADEPADTSDAPEQDGGDEEAPADETENNDDDESSEEAPADGEASEETESEE